MIDSHIHLDQYPHDQIASLLEQWRETGIEKVVAVSTSLASSYRTLELKVQYPDFILAALGAHPEEHPPSDFELAELTTLIRRERSLLSAIGEVGLPHYALDRLPSTALNRQQELLHVFAALAGELSLPLVLHAVHDKAALAVNCLRQHAKVKAHFHWLKAPSATVTQILSDGHYLSLTPEVCYQQRDQLLAARIPMGQLLLETDGPWPFAGPFAGQMTSPLMLFQTAEMVAAIKGVSKDHLIRQCAENAVRLYS
ncbi:MAG: TatD family hydrolase [Brevibacillus sp.]|nr:TatD family hydrolase [Brevibacillus sp.]